MVLSKVSVSSTRNVFFFTVKRDERKYSIQRERLILGSLRDHPNKTRNTLLAVL